MIPVQACINWLQDSRTKIALRAWNKNVFGRVDENLKTLAEQ